MSKIYIPNIHNYCDRWCERCPFNDRCRVYAEESNLSPEEKDVNNEAFWDRLSDNFKNTIDLLHKIASEAGIDLGEAQKEADLRSDIAAPGPSAEPDEIEPRPKTEKAKQMENLERRARRYSKQVDRFFDFNQDFFLEKQTELEKTASLSLAVDRTGLERLQNAFDVVRWHQFFIAAKTHRSLSGLEFDENFEFGQDPVQNDSNGSAKIALIAIERSSVAWETVRQCFPEKTDELLDIFVLLEKLRIGLESFFPRAKEFVRPGFDEPSAEPATKKKIKPSRSF